jgi:hypothetical protein
MINLANSFSTYFLIIEGRLDDTYNPTQEKTRMYMSRTPSRTFPNTNLNEVRYINNFLKLKKKKNKIKINKYDGILTALLETFSGCISVPLCYLCNQPVNKRTFP